ncbi:YceI family protein [Duganella sp. Root336D2]|uniref:YceI family protein n=1 Tax=Duganella sp. Root336D2 TaxID=1736518 RepID=UPI001E332A76|nr:YceI family protein [Duganella sp. Root336D2]
MIPALQASQSAHRIVGGDSLVAITVRRGGPLARMGHDHVVATRQLEGFVDLDQGRTELRFRLDQLTVDEAALRKEAGLDTQPSLDAIDGTRRNMFSKVLQAQAHPWVLVRAAFEAGTKDRLRAEVTLHGVTREYKVPLHLREEGATVLASGTFTVKQTDFGITPFAVFGGALAVKDELELRFAISARR